MKLILLEGLDNVAIQTIMDDLESKLKANNKKVSSVMFPRYNEKSGELVKHHLMGFPKPNLKESYSLKEISSIVSKDELLFVKDINNSTLSLIKVKVVSKLGLQGIDCITDFGLTFTDADINSYKFYKAMANDIFNWGVKASHTTKALLFTIDRNIWFANHRKEIENLDYLIVNRSYLSNFLYRTVNIQDSYEFLEYLISIFKIEVEASGLNDFEIIPYFIRTDNIDAELEYAKKYYLEHDLTYVNNIKRDEQYIKTIWYNYNHLRDLMMKTKEFTNLYDKYAKYIDMNTIDLLIKDYIYNLKNVVDDIYCNIQ